MSSLLNRLKGLQAEVDVPLTHLSHLSLTDLEQEKVSFGQKHLGHTFSQAWEDQQWINFMVSKYAESKVMSHRRLIRFVELRVEAHEAAQAVIPALPPKQSQASAAETADHSGRRFIQPKAKAYAGGFPVPTSAMDEELQELAEFEMYSSGTSTHATESGSRFPGDDRKDVAHGDGPDQSHSPLGSTVREED